MKERERNNSKLTVIILIIITLVATALIVLFIIIATKNLEADQAQAMNSQRLIEELVILGDSPAPVTVLNSGDFTFSSYKTWGEESIPKKVSNYV
ncbi:hypothetical protein J4760_12775 [Salinicoccus sp. ID82-1]|uniref:hypothetical protein n=1 Tax=Salinicoccus sp. ID82-1 TaxID=2820269 RepID=UPI001F474C25|nr:hypothetical protein [Salinicoccus sp. ID82-1]MCG1010896.1 hypothetical protein [Salinicoccus sp. ID82-1]